MRPVYIDWMDPVTGDVILVGQYKSISEAAEAMGVQYNAVHRCLQKETVCLASGCQAHYGKPKAKSMTSYITLEG